MHENVEEDFLSDIYYFHRMCVGGKIFVINYGILHFQDKMCSKDYKINLKSAWLIQVYIFLIILSLLLLL